MDRRRSTSVSGPKRNGAGCRVEGALSIQQKPLRSTRPLQTESHGSLGLNLTAPGTSADDRPGSEKLSLLRSLYEQRLRNVVGQLRDTMHRVRGDATVQTMLGDASSAEFATVRRDLRVWAGANGTTRSTRGRSFLPRSNLCLLWLAARSLAGAHGGGAGRGAALGARGHDLPPRGGSVCP